MDRKITSRLNMANAVKEVCGNNSAIVALVPAFVVLVALLGGHITALKALIKKVSVKLKGLKTEKDEWREKLSLLLSVVCGVGVSYSRKIEDVVMEGKFGYAETILSNMRDTELIETANVIIELQATVAEQLVEYGITTELMELVKQALKEFDTSNPKPIVNIYTSEVEREAAMAKAFELSDFILQDMMKAALIYKVLNPDFYQSLENASHISKVGVRHEDDPAAAAAKKEAKEKKAAEKKKLAKEASEKKDLSEAKEATEKKEAQDGATASELLDKNVDAINSSNKTPEPPVNEH